MEEQIGRVDVRRAAYCDENVAFVVLIRTEPGISTQIDTYADEHGEEAANDLRLVVTQHLDNWGVVTIVAPDQSVVADEFVELIELNVRLGVDFVEGSYRPVTTREEFTEHLYVLAPKAGEEEDDPSVQ